MIVTILVGVGAFVGGVLFGRRNKQKVEKSIAQVNTVVKKV